LGFEWLDDFGTGFASLTHLLTVPADILKIDKSFVHRLAPGNASMAIIQGLLQIAGKLNIGVIAEGIETRIRPPSFGVRSAFSEIATSFRGQSIGMPSLPCFRKVAP
jgi:predicted signal transduction protein with EAL and GGDEF domain